VAFFPVPWRWDRLPPSVWPHRQRPKNVVDTIVPVRVMGTTVDDEEASVYGVDSQVAVAVPAAGNRAAAIFSTNGAHCEVLYFDAYIVTDASNLIDESARVQIGTGPRAAWVGLDVAAGASDMSGLYGAYGKGLATIQGGRSSANPGGELVQVPATGRGGALPHPIFLHQDQSLIFYQTSAGAGGAQTGHFVVYWRERRA